MGVAGRRRGARLAVVAVIATGLLTACFGGSSEQPTVSPTVVPTADGGYNAALRSVVRPSEEEGGTLRLGASTDCESWDPGRAPIGWCQDMQRLITRSLTGFAAAPGTAGTEVVPDLAETLGKPNADLTEWTYTLRPGVTWQDGTPITSRDVKYGIERLYATDVIVGGPAYYYRDLLDQCVTPIRCSYQGPYKDKTGGLRSIRTPNDKTIVFSLTRPYASFDYLMALPTAAPVPKAKDLGPNYSGAVQASGPFKVGEVEEGASISFVRNPRWDAATDDIRRPLADEVVLSFEPDVTDLAGQLEAGELDMIADGGIEGEYARTVLGAADLRSNADNPATGVTYFLSLIPSVPPLDDPACREAVFYALDKQALQTARGGEVVGGEVARIMTPPMLPGFDRAADPFPSGPGSTGDLEKATAKLAECGSPSGFRLKMAFVPEGVGPAVFQATKQALARVGITVKAAPGPASRYYTSYVGSPDRLERRGVGLASTGWLAEIPNTFGFWQPIANGSSIRERSNTNFASLSDPKVNELLDAPEAGSPDPAVQAEIGPTVDEAVSANAVYLPYVHGARLTYRSPRTTNVYVNGTFGLYDYVNVGVAED